MRPPNNDLAGAHSREIVAFADIRVLGAAAIGLGCHTSREQRAQRDVRSLFADEGAGRYSRTDPGDCRRHRQPDPIERDLEFEAAIIRNGLDGRELVLAR